MERLAYGEYAESDRETEYIILRRLMRQTEEDNPTARLLGMAIREDLTPRQAQMVRLYSLEQHTMRDIAGTLGVNISTVSRTLSAARKKLRRCLRYTSRALLRQD